MRSCTSRHVEPKKLKRILGAARVAPTAANLQPIRLIVVQSEQSLARIGKAANIYGAPLAIIVCADHERTWVRPSDKKQTGNIDTSILTGHMMLQATGLGLRNAWVCYFNPDILCRELELSEHLEPANILAIGYSNAGTADTSYFSRQRITLSQLITYEK